MIVVDPKTYEWMRKQGFIPKRKPMSMWTKWRFKRKLLKAQDEKFIKRFTSAPKESV